MKKVKVLALSDLHLGELETLVYNSKDGHNLIDVTIDKISELWTEKTKEFGSVLFDYFFLTEGANEELIGIDHIYPEEFLNILEASDHISIALDLGDE